METILLTGATGFLGSHILERLLKENYNPLILKRSFSNTWRIKHLLSNVIFYDIDNVPLETIYKEHNIDAVIHTATTYGKNREDNSAIIESNLLLPVRLIDLSISHNTKTFINTDSFFNSENINYQSLGYYTLSKKQLIEWLKLLSNNIQIVNLKLEHLYGPKDSNNKFVMWLINECIKNTPNLKLTEGTQKRDFIYVSDAVDAFILTLKNRGQVPDYSEFEVGTGKGTSIKDFAVNIRRAVSVTTGKKIDTLFDFGAIPYKEGEIMESTANTSALKQLGWEYHINLETGLDKTVKEALRP